MVKVKKDDVGKVVSVNFDYIGCVDGLLCEVDLDANNRWAKVFIFAKKTLDVIDLGQIMGIKDYPILEII